MFSLESELLSVLNTDKTDSFAKEELYEYKSIFLTRISADDTNPRFLPAVIISDLHALEFTSRKLTKQQLINIYDARDKVLIGKSCIVNCFKYGCLQFKKANSTIESIFELAKNIAVSEIIQVPTIYPENLGRYRVLTGHRRFFAMIYNEGINGAAHFKVYNSKPLLLKTKQFQENTSREELPQYGKLLAFQDAQKEMDILNSSRQRLGKKPLTVKEIANLLGVSMGSYDNFNVLTRYPAVIQAFEYGLSEPLINVKKLTLKTENTYKKKHNIDKLNVNDRKEINSLLEAYFNPEDRSVKLADLTKVYNNTYKLGNIESSFVMKTLLTNNVCEIECGIDWHTVDWNNTEEINDIFKKLVAHISDMDSSNKEQV